MQDMEQHHKAARNDRMSHPEQGRNEAEPQPQCHRQRLTQGLAGEQRSQHPQQARRRKIRPRRQQRL